jgi:glycosyltransferase involved in cell wall biosynthesis
MIVGKYILKHVDSIDQADLQMFFGGLGKCVYVVSYPDDYFHKLVNIENKRNYSIAKKQKFFSHMPSGSLIVSPTETVNRFTSNRDVVSKDVVYMRSSFKYSRFKQIQYSINLLRMLLRMDPKFRTVVFYNVEFPLFFVAWLLKLIGNFKIILDLEDNYHESSTNIMVNLLRRFSYKLVDGAILINRNCQKYFPLNSSLVVHNAFLEKGYKFSKKNLKNGDVLFFGGTLDEIRGVSLIPKLVLSLRKSIGNFTLKISGSGPLTEYLKNLNYPELVFLGYLDETEYLKEMQSADAFLILQLPDHPFSLGSFPSKIEYYAKFKKPIYRLDFHDE